MGTLRRQASHCTTWTCLELVRMATTMIVLTFGILIIRLVPLPVVPMTTFIFYQASLIILTLVFIWTMAMIRHHLRRIVKVEKLLLGSKLENLLYRLPCRENNIGGMIVPKSLTKLRTATLHHHQFVI